MTFAQAAIVAILLGMLVAYATERFRVELVALCGLAAGFVTGVVPIQNVFAGFASSAVITVVEVLLVVAALSRARVIDSFARRIVYHFKSERAVLAIICTTGAAVSVFMNNVGALALMFPVAMSVCQRLDISPARVLMPLSFATLLGGMCSLTGTPANLVVNQWLIGETGKGFGYFELALLGGPLTVAGLVWLVSASPHLFARFTEGSSAAEPSPVRLVAERRVPQGSPLIGLRLPQVADEHDLFVHGVMREGAHVFARRSDIALVAGDTLVVEADLSLLDELEEAGALVPPRPTADGERQEYVVMPESLLLGSRVGSIPSFVEHSLEVVGLSIRRGRIEGSFDELQIGMGDVLVLAGDRDELRRIAAECSLLPLSSRRPSRFTGRAWLSLGIFAAG
ncbi:MAG: SLC13 family permease, partial [Porphyrobacter sp.]|nr:SLC13 family permease [Porphyrobacter sp.]